MVSELTNNPWQRFRPGETVIAPSLLAADFAEIGKEVRAVEDAGAQALHLDIMDGHFVPNISFGADVVRAARANSAMLFDTHLMLSRPQQYIKQFREAGSDSITIHVECDDDIAATLREIRSLGAAAGLSLRPGTPADAVLPYLELLDLILVMTVEPGFGGQSFMSGQLPKLSALKHELDRCAPGVRLEVDGGIAPATAPLCIAGGADTLVAGSSIFRHKGSYSAAIAALRQDTFKN